MRRQRLSFIALIFVVTVAAPLPAAFAQAESPLFLGNQNIPPILYRDGDQPKGVAADIFAAIAKRLPDLELHLELTDWKEAQDRVQSGDVSGLVQLNRNPAREKYLLFSDPLLTSEFVIFRQSDRGDLQTVDDLKGKKVAIEAAGYPASIVRRYPDIRPVVVGSWAEGFEKVRNGTADALIVDRWVGEYVLAQKNIKGIRSARTPVETLVSHIAVRNDRPELLTAINGALADIKRSGAFDEILDNWRGDKIVYVSERERQLQGYVELGLAIVAGLSISLAFLAYMLRRKSLALKSQNDLLFDAVVKKTNEAIAERDHLQEIIWGTNVGTWVWNVQTGEVIFNERWADIVGYTLEELSPVSIDTWLKLAHPVDMQRSSDLLQAHFSGESDHYECEARMQHKDGHWVWVLDRGKVVEWTDDGKPLRMSGTHSDITAQKNMETMLRESEAKFRDYAECSSDWIWETDEEHRFTYLSDRFEEVTRIPVPFFLGKTREDLAREDFLADKWIELRNRLKEQEPFRNFQYRRAGPDGRTQYIESSGVPIFRNDKFIGYRGTGRDVTERQTQFERAKIAEEQLRAAIDSLNEAFVIYDEDDRLLICNEKYREYYPQSADLLVPGTKFEDIIRKGVERGQYPEAIGQEEVWIQRRLYDHRMADTNVEQELPDGRWLQISERKTPSGSTVGHRFDITDLKKAVESANAANKAKSEFLASMSHEIRTPMTGVVGFADLLLDDNLSASAREKVYNIKDSAESLLAIINDVLDMSKLEAGRVDLEYIDFHLGDLMEEVQRLFYKNNKKRQRGAVALTAEFSDDFPENAYSDPTRLRQILVNLVGNAMKFTEHGKVTIRGRLERRPGMAPTLYFEVEDTGIGIKSAVLDVLFTDFTQADASISRRFEGTGLGLSICQKLVRLLDGEIGVESVEGEGSTFWFRVPYQPATKDVPAVASIGKRLTSTYVAQRKLHILAVDDNGLNRQIISAVLAGYGHSVELAEHGMEAVEKHERGNFDLILMDIRMPVVSGHEATRLIRGMDDAKADIPIIALTADATADHKRDHIAAGMNAVVTKPIDRSELAVTINEVMAEGIHVLTASADDDQDIDEVEEDDAASDEVDASVADFLKQIGATNTAK